MMHSPKSAVKPSPKSSVTFDAIGTRWQIDCEDVHNRLPQIKAIIDSYDQAFSRFRPDSFISKMSQRHGTFTMPEHGYELLSFYSQMHKATGGLVTPLIGQTLSDLGYDAKYSLVPNEDISITKQWGDVLSFNEAEISIEEPTLLDFGAAGKGQLVDLISDFLGATNQSYCVDAGGDIRLNQKLAIGLENPDNFDEVIGVAQLNRGSLCGSAGNRRNWGSYNHIINPVNSQSPERIKATWVYTDTAMIADGLATCLFFSDPTELRNYFSFEFVILYSDNSAQVSDNFPGELF